MFIHVKGYEWLFNLFFFLEPPPPKIPKIETTHPPLPPAHPPAGKCESRLGMPACLSSLKDRLGEAWGKVCRRETIGKYKKVMATDLTKLFCFVFTNILRML